MRNRVVIEGVQPEIDGGRFPIKRVTGEQVAVEADVFADGHDLVSGALLYRFESDREWAEVPLEPLLNDRWRASFSVTRMGRYLYTLRAWVDHFKSWRRDTEKKLAAGQDISLEIVSGTTLVRKAAESSRADAAARLSEWLGKIESAGDSAEKSRLLFSPSLLQLMSQEAPRRHVTVYDRELPVQVDRPRARFSTWYEMFPRSCSQTPGRHGTFLDCIEQLPYIAAMGFDVLYLPPIHPIGGINRKGPNNAVVAQPEDPGSPWAIGSAEGGHKSIHPDLGTPEDFRRLVREAEKREIEVALDLAYQCAPDHPYAREHPEWFRHRPDGSIQFAENPPKRYEDIYPFDFECEDVEPLWKELKSVVLFWIEHGVKIFRVDNPHTKPFPFWEWLIGGIKQEFPEAIFLSEAFTRPKVMYRLAKLGFTQSYTYFAWRNTRWELQEYLSELTQTPVREFFRPNLWPNTPDILTQYLQAGGRPAFIIRLVLAATLGASYGIYGPAFELVENRAREWGSEEYLDSEKYQIRQWDRSSPDSLKDVIGRVNRIRRENPALQWNDRLRFHSTDNDNLIAYSKESEDGSNLILTAVNLDPYHTQSGWLDFPLEEFQIDPHQSFQVHDLLTGARYLWQGRRNYIELNPHAAPAHIFRVRRRVRSEHDFEYFM